MNRLKNIGKIMINIRNIVRVLIMFVVITSIDFAYGGSTFRSPSFRPSPVRPPSFRSSPNSFKSTPRPSLSSNKSSSSNFNSKAAQKMNLNAAKVKNRNARVEDHYKSKYGKNYNTYISQPPVNVGGGYSPLFWYAMLTWPHDRQANWMHHNQNNINQELYKEQLEKDPELKKKIEELKNTPIDPNYIDPEFKDNPDLMYTQEYIDETCNNGTTIAIVAGVFTFLIVCFLFWILFSGKI